MRELIRELLEDFGLVVRRSAVAGRPDRARCIAPPKERKPRKRAEKPSSVVVSSKTGLSAALYERDEAGADVTFVTETPRMESRPSSIPWNGYDDQELTKAQLVTPSYYERHFRQMRTAYILNEKLTNRQAGEMFDKGPDWAKIRMAPVRRAVKKALADMRDGKPLPSPEGVEGWDKAGIPG